MSKPETLKELMIAGDLTMGEARRLTRKVFNGNEVLVQDLIPYTITVPNLDDLPDHVTSFVIKAMLEASIVNVMDRTDADDAADATDFPFSEDDGDFDKEAHYAAFGSDGEPDDDVIGIPSCSEGTKDGDNLPPKDGEFNG